MTGLDTFRRALKDQDLPGLDTAAPRIQALDTSVIMAKGRRLRRRRRVAAAGGVLCLAAAVFGAAAGISQLTRPSPVLGLRPATSGGSSSTPISSARPVPAPVPSVVRVGRVVPAGIREGGGELVFYGVRVHASQLPRVSFGIMAGLRSHTGALTGEVETNETTGSATTPGFHAIEAAMNVGRPAVAVPEFGYYAGPAASITARQDGHLVHASLARWSASPGIVIFWFPATTTHPAPVTGLAAYTATGHHLPAGHTTTGIG